MPDHGEVTRLLAAIRGGDPDALNDLFPVIYDQLRELAHRQLSSGSPATLCTTVVVHETYLKLMGSQGLRPEDRSHFFALAARAMRQVLIDYVRVRLAAKRGGGAPHTSLEGRDIAVEDRAAELLDLDAALERLHGVDARLGRLVELRFFAGLSVEETAELLAVSPRTVKRDWQKARALLYDDLHGEVVPEDGA